MGRSNICLTVLLINLSSKSMGCQHKGRSHRFSPSMFSGLDIMRQCIVRESSRMLGLYRSVYVCVCAHV